MTRLTIILSALLTWSTSVAADTIDVSGLLRQMPDSIWPLLTRNDRLDMVDFAQSKMGNAVTNRLGGSSRIDTLAADYARVRLSHGVSAEIALVGQQTDSAACRILVLTTYGTLDRETAIALYSSRWQRLPFPALGRDSLTLAGDLADSLCASILKTAPDTLAPLCRRLTYVAVYKRGAAAADPAGAAEAQESQPSIAVVPNLEPLTADERRKIAGAPALVIPIPQPQEK